MFRTLMVGAVSLTVLMGGVASAQPYGNHHDRRESSDRNDRSRHDNDRRGRHDDNRRGSYGERHGMRDGAHRRWARGNRLPASYYSRDRYVDHRRYNLRAPPRGYRWVKTDDNQYIMVAIASGLIAQVLLR
jgi:Ni/Co efflux regulator RcnB